ncbi:MAG: L-asparaginase II [Planctomycetota bacterium]|jgi:L-asparaginase II
MSQSAPNSANPQSQYSDNPVLVRVWRGNEIESVHRGAWALVDSDGLVIKGAGDYFSPIFARSTVKSLQALPLFETGAAEKINLESDEIALAISSHNAEPCHTEVVSGLLERLDLGVEHLRCGVQQPGDRKTRLRMNAEGQAATALHNNCSGKHAGFLALSRHLGVEPANYLDPNSAGQKLIRQAVADMCGVDADLMSSAIDGCSAPTFRMPLFSLGRGFARVTNPVQNGSERGNWCKVMQTAIAKHPELVAGNHRRIDTDLIRATNGRLFPKVGAEAVYAVGEVGGGRALAVKIDDGGLRGMHRVVIGLLEQLEMLSSDELEKLEAWRNPIVKNFAGLEVGREELLI